ncbi:MAG: hypothetical protein K6F01_11115 [Selenomonas sp.]|uniref:hypothetical protein n=1 Tax=Selenomonas sp. TaxID=2053611 RepID=UPI0025CCF560|nr:hypothetical protein [Selenomonas sp.]MCR5439966.1 hypothetical protein [Selenomonas sp.]
MFKLGMSLVFAFISAMVIALAGLVSDVRLMTVLLRSLVGFLVAGAVVWLVAFVLEAKELVGFDKNLELMENPEGEEPKSPEEYEAEDEAAAAEAEAPSAEMQTSDEDNADFQPLTSNNLKHMEAPSDN